jgi:5-methylcytosine-specific restriction endonuclease McrA
MFDDKAYAKEYYQANKAKWVAWKKRNRTKLRRLALEYYRAHRAERLAAMKLYNKLNGHIEAARRIRDRLKIREWHRAYIGTPKYLAFQKRYRRRAVQNSINRHCREKNATGSHTLEQWEALKKKHGDRCAYCGKVGEMTRDHIVPLSRGGANSLDNLTPACKSCNSSKRDKSVQEWKVLNG